MHPEKELAATTRKRVTKIVGFMERDGNRSLMSLFISSLVSCTENFDGTAVPIDTEHVSVPNLRDVSFKPVDERDTPMIRPDGDDRFGLGVYHRCGCLAFPREGVDDIGSDR